MAKRRSQRRSTFTPLGFWVMWGGVVCIAGVLAWIWWSSGQHGGARESEDPRSTPSARGEFKRKSKRAEAPPATSTVAIAKAPVLLSTSPASPAAVTSAPPVLRTESTASGTVTSVPPEVPTAPTSRVEQAVTTAPDLKREQWVGVQMALLRRGISAGPIDGVLGSQTRTALRVFQSQEGLPRTGLPDPATLKALRVDGEALGQYRVTAEDLARLTPVPKSWLGKSSTERLDYENVLELVSEKAQAHPRLIRQLNPNVDWQRVTNGTVVRVPTIAAPVVKAKASRIRISLGEKTLRVFDTESNLMAHFPCSIARRVEKRPIGELRVVKLAPNPNYRFDPEIFPESEEARKIRRKLMIPPGPNNPVGTAWIGLDKPGYGIHGTPHPEDVGRTESHGCFRLANWDAERLLKMAWVGMPVQVEP